MGCECFLLLFIWSIWFFWAMVASTGFLCLRVPDVRLTDPLNSYLDEIDRITAKMYFPTDGE